MKHKKTVIWGGILLIGVLLIRGYSSSPDRVENGYSTGFYPGIASVLRGAFGWIPFSLGDILYGLLVAWLFWLIYRGARAIWKRQAGRDDFFRVLLRSAGVFLVIYLVFNIFWGINYNRLGIAKQLDLRLDKYSIEELREVNQLLVEKVNASKLVLIRENREPPPRAKLFSMVVDAYAKADSLYPFLHYRTPSIKSSLWGWLGNYLGFTGYYNPFTGEAQVNTTVPYFLQPYISCHEVAHQLGYAKENEANSVGYLADSASDEPLLHYSMYLDLFMYSNRNLYRSDSSSARNFARQLLPEVRTDIKTWRDFNRRHNSLLEPVFRWVYGKYLEKNEQPQGVLSYDQVTSFLIAYYKKYGTI